MANKISKLGGGKQDQQAGKQDQQAGNNISRLGGGKQDQQVGNKISRLGGGKQDQQVGQNGMFTSNDSRPCREGINLVLRPDCLLSVSATAAFRTLRHGSIYRC
ncbi:hypothetical protein OIU78_010442 [Salix suchowensis]|nr:hypothetical protein OIU78_010442 [Salix suchowensis]